MLRLKLLGVAFVWAGIVSFAQTPASVWDGIFTKEQAQKGEAAYKKQCGSCHGEELEGRGPTPPLAGSDFLGNWNGMSVGDLFDKIQTSMPADRPGQLTPQENAFIVAYMLEYNKFPAGQKELPSDLDALKKIRFEAKNSK